jgi:hypothetical protein
MIQVYFIDANTTLEVKNLMINSDDILERLLNKPPYEIISSVLDAMDS